MLADASLPLREFAEVSLPLAGRVGEGVALSLPPCGGAIVVRVAGFPAWAGSGWGLAREQRRSLAES